VELRDATVEDIPALLAVLRAAFEEYRGRLDPPSGVHGETAGTIRKKLNTGSAVVAEIDGDVVGCVFYAFKESCLDLGRLAVLPRYRRHGVGRALVENVERQARALNVAHVELGVRLALPYLQAYYEALGYRPIRYGAHEGYPESTYVILAKDV
jgi:predicted N-acetyltransferase YhbS